MSYLTVENATKIFGEKVRALDGVSFAVERDEFFTLLGPSGCGKTTLLRSIAGFADLTAGSIALAGARLDPVPSHKRDIGMVFQDYAVFPHLTVSENVAFGLKARRVPAAETAARVDEALATVRLREYKARLPAALSGGQQQRIGLARAMVIRPKLLLMDEPLSNLDAKLRVDLRDEIRDIQKKVGIAAIYVTHDQEEALAISDRICVMNAGRIEQIGTPQEIYANPRTIFVATFVGTMNTLPREAAPISGSRRRRAPTPGRCAPSTSASPRTGRMRGACGSKERSRNTPISGARPTSWSRPRWVGSWRRSPTRRRASRSRPAARSRSPSAARTCWPSTGRVCAFRPERPECVPASGPSSASWPGRS
jgi:iron(III) transport system ATP-binding protein